MSYSRYKLRDYTFGLLALKLRERTRLAQIEIASLVGVTEKAIRNWEVGTSYPTAAHLKKLIEVYMRHGAFMVGQEREEAKILWERSCLSKSRRRASFDEGWFTSLLDKQRPHAGDERLQDSDSLASLADSKQAYVTATSLSESGAGQNAVLARRLSHVDWGEAVDVSA